MPLSSVPNPIMPADARANQATRPSGRPQSGEAWTGFAAVMGQVAEAQTSSPLSVWKELARQCDVRNATFAELKAMSSQLYQAGQIDLLHLAVLTFDPSRIYRQTGNSPSHQFLTPGSPAGRRDWIAEYQARANREFKAGNTLGYQRLQECLAILRRLAAD